jgi:hypothetical protein
MPEKRKEEGGRRKEEGGKEGKEVRISVRKEQRKKTES